MSRSKPGSYLSFDDWPEDDRDLWDAATRNDDPFAGAAGARLAKRTLHAYRQACRAFLGFLTVTEPAALNKPHSNGFQLIGFGDLPGIYRKRTHPVPSPYRSKCCTGRPES
jgi:hypothetical protein